MKSMAFQWSWVSGMASMTQHASLEAGAWGSLLFEMAFLAL